MQLEYSQDADVVLIFPDGLQLTGVVLGRRSSLAVAVAVAVGGVRGGRPSHGRGGHHHEPRAGGGAHHPRGAGTMVVTLAAAAARCRRLCSCLAHKEVAGQGGQDGFVPLALLLVVAADVRHLLCREVRVRVIGTLGGWV